MLEADDEIVRVAHHDNVTPRMVLAPVRHPQIHTVVQDTFARNGEMTDPLRRTH